VPVFLSLFSALSPGFGLDFAGLVGLAGEVGVVVVLHRPPEEAPAAVADFAAVVSVVPALSIHTDWTLHPARGQTVADGGAGSAQVESVRM